MNPVLDYVYLRRHGKSLAPQMQKLEDQKKQEVQKDVDRLVGEIETARKSAQTQLDEKIKELEEDKFLAPLERQLKVLQIAPKEIQDAQGSLQKNNDTAKKDLEGRVAQRKELQTRVQNLRQTLQAKRQVPEEGKIFAIGDKAVKHVAGIPQERERK